VAGRAPARAALPPTARTLPEVLLHWGRTRPEQVLFYVLDLEDQLTALTAGELLQEATRLAAHLRRRGVTRGDRVVLSFDTSPEFLESFFACSLLGAIPCLVELPSSKVSVQSWGERLRGKLQLLGARAMIMDADFQDLAQGTFQGPPPEGALGESAAPFITSVKALLAEPGAEPFEPPTLAPEDTAFIQFTSGTTSSPRGVVISHRALLANCAEIGETGRWTTDDLMVSWLPLFHDMGLVASALSSFTHGLPTALLPPFSFLLKPSRWLWALHFFRGTSSFSPNFAYQLCVKRIKDAELKGLELSGWRRAYNAAEFIHADTVRTFRERFAPYGFDPDAMVPAYGMAEMVVGVTCRDKNEPLWIETVSRSTLASQHRAVPLPEGGSDALTLVSVGRLFRTTECRIVDEEGHPLGERQEGEILLRGPSLFDGYYANPEATHSVLRDGWLYTGDLGYLANGQLFICGRIKDLIIKAGENHHPYTMESAAAQVSGVRAGCVAAVGVNNTQSGTEDIVILFETQESSPLALRPLCKYVEDLVYQGSGVRPNRVIPLPPHSLPKTTSGKIKRAYIRENILAFENLSLLLKKEDPAVH
jgi:acyl-CoA synthetase (AMP-forming)/AMP-acid ligase II